MQESSTEEEGPDDNFSGESDPDAFKPVPEIHTQEPCEGKSNTVGTDGGDQERPACITHTSKSLPHDHGDGKEDLGGSADE